MMASERLLAAAQDVRDRGVRLGTGDGRDITEALAVALTEEAEIHSTYEWAGYGAAYRGTYAKLVEAIEAVRES
jgi:hypothetical protein